VQRESLRTQQIQIEVDSISITQETSGFPAERRWILSGDYSKREYGCRTRFKEWKYWTADTAHKALNRLITVYRV